MNQRLKRAAEEGDIDFFYAVIRESPNLLERIDKIPFVDTPLHLAASAGHTQFAMEMMRLKPSFARKPNPDGFSPMHLALQNGQTKMVIRFLEVDPDLVRVKGREGLSPLHYVAETGNLDLLAVFLSVCPKSMDDVTIRSQTALHIAVEKDMFEACEVLVGWLQQGLYEGGRNFREKILNWKDEEGNTALHIATSNNSHKAVELLLVKCNNGSPVGVLQVNATNKSGLTALDLCLLRPCEFGHTTEIETLLRRFGGVRAMNSTDMILAPPDINQVPTQPAKPSINPAGNVAPSSCTPTPSLESREGKSWDDYFKFQYGMDKPSDVRTALLVVVVLMATTTFQAGQTPPGGLHEEGPKKGQALMASTPISYIWFMFFNSAGFFVSLRTILVLTNGFPMFWELCFAIIAMAATYDSALVQASPQGYLRTVSYSFSVLIPIGIPCVSAMIRKYYRK